MRERKGGEETEEKETEGKGSGRAPETAYSR